MEGKSYCHIVGGEELDSAITSYTIYGSADIACRLPPSRADYNFTKVGVVSTITTLLGSAGFLG